MTVIAYKDGVMASDGASFSGGMRYRAMHEKVIRCSVGLVGAAGRSLDCQMAKDWLTRGLPESRPTFSGDKDDPMQIIWAKPDGTLWVGDERLAFNQIQAPGAIGETNACAFVEGAMAAGASAEDAVRLAIEQCIYVGGGVFTVRWAAPPYIVA